MNLLTKQKETHRLRKQTYGCQEEGIVREFEMAMYTLLYLKWIINKNLLYSSGNSAQCDVAAWMGEDLGRMDTCIFMAESLYCSPETITTFNRLYANFKKKLKIKKNECVKQQGLGYVSNTHLTCML